LSAKMAPHLLLRDLTKHPWFEMKRGEKKKKGREATPALKTVFYDCFYAGLGQDLREEKGEGKKKKERSGVLVRGLAPWKGGEEKKEEEREERELRSA